MIERLNEHLVHLKSAKRRKKKWEIQLKDYEAELNAMNHNIQTLENQLKKEVKDVQKLEGISMANLFSTLLGKKHEKLEKEKQEVVAIQLKLEDAKQNREEIKQAIQTLNKNLEQVQHIQKEYEEVLAMKVDLIRQKDETFANKLYELSEKEGDLDIYLVEINEAINAGEVAKTALQQAENELSNAKGWGLFDMFGGGVIATAVKHSHVNDATKSIQEAETKLRQFQKELLDVNDEADLHVNTSSLLTFADYFFDNIVTDYMVQNRIQNSLNNIKEVITEIEHTVTKLKAEKERKTMMYQQVKEERKQLIESF